METRHKGWDSLMQREMVAGCTLNVRVREEIDNPPSMRSKTRFFWSARSLAGRPNATPRAADRPDSVVVSGVLKQDVAGQCSHGEWFSYGGLVLPAISSGSV